MIFSAIPSSSHSSIYLVDSLDFNFSRDCAFIMFWWFNSSEIVDERIWTSTTSPCAPTAGPSWSISWRRNGKVSPLSSTSGWSLSAKPAYVPLLFCLFCNQKLPVDTMNLTNVCSFPKTHRVDGPSSVNTVRLSALETSCTPAVSNTVKTTLRYLFRNVHMGFIKAWKTNKFYFNNRRWTTHRVWWEHQLLELRLVRDSPNENWSNFINISISYSALN